MTKEKLQGIRDNMMALIDEVDSAISEIKDKVDTALEEVDNAMDNLPDDTNTGNNRGKFVSRNDDHLFFHAVHKGKKLRFHIHPDGHFNVQIGDMIGTSKVAYKGTLA